MTSEAVKRFNDSFKYVLAFIDFLKSLDIYLETVPVTGPSFARLAREAEKKVLDMNEIVDNDLFKARDNVVNLNGGK